MGVYRAKKLSFSGKVWDTYRGLKQDPFLAALTVQEGTSDLYTSRVVVGTGEVRGYRENPGWKGEASRMSGRATWREDLPMLTDLVHLPPFTSQMSAFAR